jgi:hypothetical protein
MLRRKDGNTACYNPIREMINSKRRHTPLSQLDLIGFVIMVAARFRNVTTADDSFDVSEKVLSKGRSVLVFELADFQPFPRSFTRELTLMVASTFFTSPVIIDSEKSILVFHNWVKNARRNCRAVYFCNIS